MSRTEPTSYSPNLARWADRLRDISARGLCYSRDPHDVENFHKIQAIAKEMSGLSVGEADGRPASCADGVFKRPTPLIYGDGALINDDDAILLVQRTDNRTWLLPGGALEVGENAAEGVSREVREETGVDCVPETLVGVFDEPANVACFPHHMYVLTFLCRTDNPDTTGFAVPTEETLALEWFPEDALPDALYPGVSLRIEKALEVRRGRKTAYFDGIRERRL